MPTRRNTLIATGGLLTGYALSAGGTATAVLGTDYEVDRDVTYLNRSSGPIELDVYYPPKAEDYPVFLFVHGGGWTGGDKGNIAADSYGNMAQNFASRGYGFVPVNYRLAPTHTYPAAPKDIAYALNWVYNNRVHYGFDPTRVVLGGFSAGSHLSTLVASYSMFYGFDVQCPAYKPVNGVIAIDGAYDPDGDTHSNLTDFFGGTYTDKTSTWEEGSATSHTTADHPPVLIMHAQDDTTLDYKQATAYRDALDAENVPYELVNPVSGGHTFFREGDWQTKSLDKWEAFIERQV